MILNTVGGEKLGFKKAKSPENTKVLKKFSVFLHCEVGRSWVT